MASLRKSGRDVGARQRVGDVGGEEADLGAAVEALAFEFQAVERLLLGKLDHRVGELDFAAGAALLRRQDVEDLRLQDVAAGDDEVRRRLRARRLFHHLGDAEQLALLLADADDAVHVDALVRHFLDRDDVGVGAEPARGVDHLGEAAALVLDQHVGQQQRERLVPDQFARAPHGVAEAERLLLAREARGARPRQVLLEQVEVGRAAGVRAASSPARTGGRNGPR